MSTIQKFRESLFAQVKEFTYRWWTDRDEANQNFFYHIDDKYYEQVLRAEAEELLAIIFEGLQGDNRNSLQDWALLCSNKRAMQGVPADESVERFRMFRRTMIEYFHHFVEIEGIPAIEALRIAEAINNNCEIAMQVYMTHYMANKEQYFNEQMKRFDVERLASIGQMAAGIAHEVRNPLTATRGFLQLLSEIQPHYFLDIALQELDRGIQTISTLLDVAKPNLPQAPKRPVSVWKVLQDVSELFNDKLYNKKLIMEVENEDTLIAGREEVLKQAFFNVLKNAVEATRFHEDPTLTLRHKCVGDQLVVEIQDNGEGIPADKVHLLGTPFFTLKDSGVGLGLTMVYRTMHEHYAQVAVESQEGQGALFRFIFPVN